MKRFNLILFIVFTSFIGCVKTQKADLVLHNASIFSLNEQEDVFEAMAIADGKILELGTEHQIMNKYLAQEYIDGKKKVVLPISVEAGYTNNLPSGFLGGLKLLYIDEFSKYKTINTTQKLVARYHPNILNDSALFKKNENFFGIYVDSLQLTSTREKENFYSFLNILKQNKWVLSIEAEVINQQLEVYDLITATLKSYNDLRWRIENAHLLKDSIARDLTNYNLIPIIPQKFQGSASHQTLALYNGIVGLAEFNNELSVFGTKEKQMQQTRLNAICVKLENNIGRLEPQMDASFIMYSVNPFEGINSNGTSKVLFQVFVNGNKK